MPTADKSTVEAADANIDIPHTDALLKAGALRDLTDNTARKQATAQAERGDTREMVGKNRGGGLGPFKKIESNNAMLERLPMGRPCPLSRAPL